MQYLSDVSSALDWLPQLTANVAVLGRHAKSVQEGTNETRTLREDGVALCLDVREFYQSLVSRLLDRLGGDSARYCCSHFPRSLLTTFLVTGAEQIETDSRLTIQASGKKIQGGNWHRGLKEAGSDFHGIMEAFLEDPSLHKGQSFAEDAVRYRHWCHNGMERVRIAFAHEVALTFSMHTHPNPRIRDDMWQDPTPGLLECQAYLVAMDSDGRAVGVAKLTPPPVMSAP